MGCQNNDKSSQVLMANGFTLSQVRACEYRGQTVGEKGTAGS
jgi:hypothetical protein